jgi:hypothetical protein
MYMVLKLQRFRQKLISDLSQGLANSTTGDSPIILNGRWIPV